MIKHRPVLCEAHGTTAEVPFGRVLACGAPAVLPAAGVPADPATARSIFGLVAPFNAYGNTSAGRLAIRTGALRWPDDLRRVKLYRGHDRERPVAYCTEAAADAAGISMRFRAAATPDGDVALTEAAEGIRDAFSVEIDEMETDGDVITAGRIVAVALLGLPAYDDARVVSVAAEAGQPDAVITTLPAAAPAAAAGAPTVAVQLPSLAPAPAVTSRAPATVTAAGPGSTLAAAARSLALWTANPQDPDVAAALQDITYTAIGGGLVPGWLGEVWAGIRYPRRIIPRLTQQPLTNYRYVGWEWTTRPAGGTYAGDKADIPSKKPVIGPVNLTAKRWAGGNDIDRAVIDFNDTEFLTSYSNAMADDYASFTDEDALEELTTSATKTTADSVSQAFIQSLLRIGATNLAVDNILVSPNLLESLAETTAQNVNPLITALLGNMTPSQLMGMTDANLEDDYVLMWAKAAAVFRELPGSPLRFDALELARGGIDRAFFGYYRTFVTVPAAVVLCKVTTTGPGRSAEKANTVPGAMFPADANITASDAGNAAKLAGAGYVANPKTKWTAGQKMTVGAFDFNWSGSAWAPGAAS